MSLADPFGRTSKPPTDMIAIESITISDVRSGAIDDINALVSKMGAEVSYHFDSDGETAAATIEAKKRHSNPFLNGRRQQIVVSKGILEATFPDIKMTAKKIDGGMSAVGHKVPGDTLNTNGGTLNDTHDCVTLSAPSERGLSLFGVREPIKFIPAGYRAA